jgi:hypothetical protein
MGTKIIQEFHECSLIYLREIPTDDLNAKTWSHKKDIGFHVDDNCGHFDA